VIGVNGGTVVMMMMMMSGRSFIVRQWVTAKYVVPFDAAPLLGEAAAAAKMVKGGTRLGSIAGRLNLSGIEHI
jgi:hypothetical protein